MFNVTRRITLSPRHIIENINLLGLSIDDSLSTNRLKLISLCGWGCDFFRLRWAEIGCPPPYGVLCETFSKDIWLRGREHSRHSINRFTRGIEGTYVYTSSLFPCTVHNYIHMIAVRSSAIKTQNNKI